MFDLPAVLFEDEDLLVLDKPSGMPSIPERYEKGICSALDLVKRERPEAQAVHRIDKETSGVLLFCKTECAFRRLSEQFSEHAIRKTYLALVSGRPDWTERTSEYPLLPDGDREHRTVVSSRGKPSVTRFRVLETFRPCAFLEAVPETGRTHQIRVHLAREGFPILCDRLYGSGEPLLLSNFKRGYRPGAGKERPLLDRLALHASAVSFEHPRSGAVTSVEAPLPKDLKTALIQLRKAGS